MHIIKQLVTAGCLGLGLIAGAAHAGEAILDGSSLKTMQQSAKEMTTTLTEEKKNLFAAAVSVISIQEAQSYFSEDGRSVPKMPGDVSKQDREALTKRAMRLLDGMTAEEIIDLASEDSYAEARQAFGELQQKMQRKISQ